MSMMNPVAGPSGPGKFSTRTDKLTLGSTSYGEGQETEEIRTAIPGAATTGAPNLGVTAQEIPATRPPREGLFDPVEDKEVDVMRGSRLGPQGGPELLQMRKQTAKTSDALAKLLPFDTTGEIAILYQQALAIGD